MQWQNRQARANQLPPQSDWATWLILSGRGWGKTRTGAEWIVFEAISKPKTRWAVIARTHADVRDTCFEGVSGIIEVLKRYGLYEDKNYNRSNFSYKLANGSIIKGFSAEEPDRLRGPQFHGGWLDELAAWSKPDAYDQYKFGLRLGHNPKTVVTTTPRPTAIVKSIMASNGTVITRGSTFENKDNLAEAALIELELKYANTRLGRQELFGEVLDDNPGALWTRARLEETRIQPEQLPPLVRIVVGVDPAVTSNETSDSTGIVVAGMSNDGHYYVLDDKTVKASPQGWGEQVIATFEQHHASRIICEVNNGGDLVVHLLQQIKNNAPVKKVTASRGKIIRAEPIAALFEQNRAHIVGYFPQLEDQLCEFQPDLGMSSPDRLDAMVWALTDLSENSNTLAFLAALSTFCPNCKMPAPKTSHHCPACNTSLGE